MREWANTPGLKEKRTMCARAVQGRRGKKDVRERAREKTTRRVERARDGEREKERKSGGESLALYK